MHPAPLFWANLGNDIGPDKYHPVVCHLITLAMVTRNLWDRVFRSQSRKGLARHLGLNEENCPRWLAFWSDAHDKGKVTPCFPDQNDQRTEALRKRLKDAGFAFHTGDKPHGTVSTAILAVLLPEPSNRPTGHPLSDALPLLSLAPSVATTGYSPAIGWMSPSCFGLLPVLASGVLYAAKGSANWPVCSASASNRGRSLRRKTSPSQGPWLDSLL
jgi:hypothetical protein